MTKISSAIVALAVAFATVSPAMAQPMGGQHDRDHADRDQGRRVDRDQQWNGNKGRHRGHDARAGNPFRNGDRFDVRRAPNYRVVEYRQYRLRKPPRGYHWVRSGNDALLVAITSGVIASIAANRF
ncbi:RcnB family protein [Novosphingobium sp. FKTRR1]|uniref:RcnB family protein n=1 Tax=Novosphingobium sp. FKTRR1 TaxID=2879118 RepID=UPI001CF06635|nr:RcnB family protein [Novosphingobium sp. FKTRR1]